MDNFIGQKINKYTVMKLIETKKSITSKSMGTYECLCDCGKIFKLYGKNISDRTAKSCGCSNWITLPGDLAAKRQYFREVKRRATSKKMDFNLDFNKVISMVQKDCIYCHKKPSAIKKASDRKISKSYFIANGIDRIDSSKGYTEDNCVSCCQTCNTMKMSLSVKQFINHCNKISLNSERDNWLKEMGYD